MHREILTAEQVKLLPVAGMFSKDFGLVGGTAVALHLGHRRSIDFDLFSDSEFKNQRILNKILKFSKADELIVNKLDELTLLIKGIKFTFFHYPYKIEYLEKFDFNIKLPDLLTLAAMKAYALGRRAKWKDYVDLYFIASKFNGIEKINKRAKQIFGNEFNEKIFREQLSYFADINYSEQIDFMPGFAVGEKKTKQALVEFSLS